jgi:folate-dependent phosphoribosylglycinamide formyltransferase PurN
MESQIPWIAYFSQTGSEIADIAEALNRWPTRIVTNKRPETIRTIDPRIIEQGYIELSNKPTLLEYKDLLQYFKDPIITLHGWLRIMPPELCSEFSIYNGHPGLITDYPELKGKDPQVRTWEGIKKDIYPTAGCVIHRVTAGVDEGKVLSFERFATWDIATLDELFETLRDRSLHLWVNLLRGIVVDKK